jgi:hypothetical protein
VSAQKIRELGWRQGSVASDSLRLTLSGVAPSITADDLIIVLTHDCDLASEAFEEEPFAELLIARRIAKDERDGNLFRGKNPRRLQFESEGLLFEIQAKERTTVDRSMLAYHTPDASRTLPADIRGLLARWTGRRYERAALPDAFNERTARAREKIRKQLKKHADLVTAIFLRLRSGDELPEGEPYEVMVSVVADSEFVADQIQGLWLQSMTDAIETSLSDTAGVQVADCRLVPDDEFTLADMKRSIEWDVWDDLSHR